MENLKFVEDAAVQIIRLMVEFPDEVELSCTAEKDEEGELYVFSVKVNPKDEGTCIGQKGITADALRRIIVIIGYRQLRRRIYFKIKAKKPAQNPFQFRG